jgi:hypothetical protein
LGEWSIAATIGAKLLGRAASVNSLAASHVSDPPLVRYARAHRAQSVKGHRVGRIQPHATIKAGDGELPARSWAKQVSHGFPLNIWSSKSGILLLSLRQTFTIAPFFAYEKARRIGFGRQN